MNYYIFVIFVIITVLIYSLDLPQYGSRAYRSRLGQAVGCSMNLTAVLYLLWIAMSWIGVSLYSLLTGLF